MLIICTKPKLKPAHNIHCTHVEVTFNVDVAWVLCLFILLPEPFRCVACGDKMFVMIVSMIFVDDHDHIDHILFWWSPKLSVGRSTNNNNI